MTAPSTHGVSRAGFAACAAAIALLASTFATVAPAQPSPPGGQGVRYLYLIRHGAYDRDSLADDRTGNGLNALGHEQARLLGKRLAGLPIRIGSMVTSDYARARQTADDLARALRLTPVVDSLIHECTPTTDRPDLVLRNTPEKFARCDSSLGAAWSKYVRPAPEADVHQLLVCHGNVIRWFVSRVVARDPSRWILFDIGNASLTVIAVRPDGVPRLVTFSDVGHLPVEKQTWVGRGAGWGPSRPAR